MMKTGLGIRRFWQVRRAKKLLSQFIRPGDTVFDCGANKGEFADLFLTLGAKVICIEPHPGMVSHLSKRFKSHPQVVIVSKGVGDREGMASFYLSSSDQLGTFSPVFIEHFQPLNEHLNWESLQKIQLTTLDMLIQEYGTPAFCKIDVEGFELPVLQGLSQAVPALSFEYTRPMLRTSIACIHRLKEIGDYNFNLFYYGTFRWQSKHWRNADEMILFLENEIPEDILMAEIYAKIPS